YDQSLYPDRHRLPLPKRLILPALAQFAAATSGRNMTKAAYIALTTGVAMMVWLTAAPAGEAMHHWANAVLWACLAYFIYEWLVRLRHAVTMRRGWSYALSGRGLVDAAGAIAVPVAILAGADPRTAWLLSILWVLKA